MTRRFSLEIQRHTALYVISWLSALLVVFDWISRMGPHPPLNLPVIAMITLPVILPCIPVAASITIIICGILFIIAPISGPDVNWLLSAPTCLAMAVLGHRCRYTMSAIIALIVGCAPVFIASVLQTELLLAISPSIQTCSVFWCIGTTLAITEDAKQAKLLEAEQSRQQAHRLRILGMLHDSLANDLVSAILLCRTIISCQSNNRSTSADVQEIEDILEQSLTRLREDIIIPERTALASSNTAESTSSNAEHYQSDPAPNLTPALMDTVRKLNEYLASQGWKGQIHVGGDVSGIDVSTIRFIERCIRELCINILKHGDTGSFALEIDADKDCIRLYSSNPVRHRTTSADGTSAAFPSVESNRNNNNRNSESDDKLSSHCGLLLLQRELEQRNGKLQWASESGEWSVFAEIPCSRHLNTIASPHAKLMKDKQH